MSRPVKVPDVLYEDLREEADRDTISVMDVLQRRLRADAHELATLRKARAELESGRGAVRARCNQAISSDRASRGEVTRLRAESARLRSAIEARGARIVELEEALAEEMEATRTHRRARAAAERTAEERGEVFSAAAIILATGVIGFLAWRWWRQKQAQREEDEKRAAATAQQAMTGM
jgi:hypothetical protein